LSVRLVRRPLVVLLALTVFGCGGGTAETTSPVGPDAGASTVAAAGGQETTSTVASATTTAAPSSTTTVKEDGVSIEDIPPECVAVISEVLGAFEPAVKDIDWETATIDDHLAVMMSMASVSIGDTSGCEDVELDMTDEEGSALFFAVAEQEAPGAVGYFKAVMEINAALDGRESSGDCQTDIGTFEDIVAGGVPWVDLPLPEQWLVLNLMSSIGYCSMQTQGELRFRPEVEAFLAGSPFAGE